MRLSARLPLLLVPLLVCACRGEGQGAAPGPQPAPASAPELAASPVEPGAAEAASEVSLEVAAPPPALESYRGRRIARTMHWSGAGWLLRSTREAEERASELLAVLPVEPGDTVCDLGCGNGYHALPLAERVGPQGRVLAVDLQSEMLRMLEARAAERGLDNLVPIEAAAHDPHLPPDSCDLVLMVDVYHELGHPEQVLAAVRAALREDGVLVLVEFRAEDPAVPIKPLHKMSKAQLLDELGHNGYELAWEHDALPWQHVMAFRSRR